LIARQHPAARLAAVVLVLCVCLTLASASASAGIQGYYRLPTIHGDQIVFMCEGDLWKVPVGGGLATRLTSHPATESQAHFSPDGKWLAFTADYQGNPDVYVMAAEGGEPTRLTFHPANEQCVGWTPDGNHVLFTSRRTGVDSESITFKVARAGGHPEQVKIGICEDLSFSSDGRQVVFNPFTWNGTWKRYRGGTAPEVWAGDVEAGRFWKVTKNDAVDQNPMWVGDRIYMLSERSFPVNLWSCKPDGSDARQVTRHTDYDVRFADSDGKRIVYTYAAEIWVVDLGTNGDSAGASQPRKVDVTIPSDRIRHRPRVEDASKTVESYSISSDGKRVVIGSRGELWNVPAKPGGRIVQVTDASSAVRERAAAFSPDDKKIVCITDHQGEQELAILDAAGKEKPKILTKAGKGWLFTPQWSNDSKRIAYADLTGTLYVADAETGEVKKVDQDKNWELTEYAFSPDSKWIAYTKYEDNRVQSIYVHEIATGKSTCISGGFTSDYSPNWDPKGRYLYFLSNRVVNPQLDDFDRSFLVTKTAKPCAVVLAKDGKSPFLPEEMLEEDEEKDAGKDPTTQPSATKSDSADDEGENGDEKKDAKDKAKGKKKKKKMVWKDVKIDLDGIQQRVVEFPVKADNMGTMLATEDRVFWISTPTRGLAEEDDDDGMSRRERENGKLETYDLKKRKQETFIDGMRTYTLSRDGSMIAWKKAKEILVADASSKPDIEKLEEKIDLKVLPLQVNPDDEWKQIFAEAWRLQRDFYWAENMVGVDWPAMRVKYEKLLPRVATRGELNDLIGQLIGELGTSHTYVFGGDNAFTPPKPTPVGVLGADIEVEPSTGMHKFVRVLRPEVWETDIKAPLTLSHANVKEGEYLIAVNGRDLAPTDNAEQRLTNLAGVQVLLTVCSKPDKTDARDIQVETLDDDFKLRYADWCRRKREYVHEKTGGKVGYFHIPDMGGNGLVRFIKGFYPQLTKDALIIDDRNNHGGFVSQMIIEKLNRRAWAFDKPRRGILGTYPERVHLGHKCVLIDEHAGSDGDIFPDSFRTLGLGPLIGKRTWGGVIGIRADKAFVDAGVSTQPEFAWFDLKRGWGIENYGVDPDIEVEFTPDDRIAGKDPQLDRGIEEMLKAIKEKPVQRPTVPPYPVRAPKQETARNAGE
jgi:tricorn protease